MAFHIQSRLAASLLTTLLVGATVLTPLPAVALDDAEKQEFGAYIREYLLANPEILVEMQQALEFKQEAESQLLAQAAISENGDAIFRSPEDMVLGNPVGDVTLVEFFDYNCGFCKRAMQDIAEIAEADENVRIVVKEFPILGQDSADAHQVSMAFRKLAPEKYADFHFALLGGDVRATGPHAIDLAKSFGVEENALRDAMADPDIDASIRKSYELANALGINGTPAFVIGDEAIFGAVGTKVLLGKMENVRQCQSTVC